jgi:hypothetical protein
MTLLLGPIGLILDIAITVIMVKWLIAILKSIASMFFSLIKFAVKVTLTIALINALIALIVVIIL